MIYGFFIFFAILILVWIFSDFLQTRLFSLGIISALLITIGDFYMKYTNNHPWDYEGFAVMNLGLALVYILVGLAFFLLIAVLENFKKAGLFALIFITIALIDFYFLGMYSPS